MPDAAQDEILPGRLDAGRRAIQAHQQHRGQSRRFHRHPQNADVVGQQRQQHGEHEHLIHAVIEPQAARRQLAARLFDAHVDAAEQRGGKADECGQRNQEDVESIDEEQLVPQWSSGRAR